MAHLKKRVTFAGVDYILVPVELWNKAKETLNSYWFSSDEDGNSYNNDEVIEISEAMDAYEHGETNV